MAYAIYNAVLRLQARRSSPKVYTTAEQRDALLESLLTYHDNWKSKGVKATINDATLPLGYRFENLTGSSTEVLLAALKSNSPIILTYIPEWRLPIIDDSPEAAQASPIYDPRSKWLPSRSPVNINAPGQSHGVALTTLYIGADGRQKIRVLDPNWSTSVEWDVAELALGKTNPNFFRSFAIVKDAAAAP